MTYFETVAGAVERVAPDVPDSAVQVAMDTTVRIYRNALSISYEHRGTCVCPDCELVCPWKPEERWHGSMNGYGYHKCRCDRCKREARQVSRNSRKGRR